MTSPPSPSPTFYFNDTVKGYNWYFHPCGNVTVPQCAQLQGSPNDPSGNVMICQNPYNAAYSYPVAVWIPESTQSLTTWQAYGGGGGQNGGNRGVRMTLQDGGDCGNGFGDRQIIVNFQCSNSVQAGLIQILNITETSTCRYSMTVLTRATCTGPNSTASQNGQVQCGTTGLTLDTITTTDLIYKDTAKNYTYYFRPCGIVTSSQCANSLGGDVAGLSMMCQATGTNNEITTGTYDLAWWNPSLATWRRFEYSGNTGWSMSIADGTSCPADNGINRQLTVYFVCDQTATTPFFQSLNETYVCNYIAVVRTILACNQSQILTTTSPCGGPYDLTFATQRDLIYQQPGTTAYYVFRPCGIVDNAVCQAQGNTNQSMMCQAYQGQTGTNDIAIYNPSLVQYTPNLNGISMYIADGDSCGGTPRSLTVNFVCQQGPGNNIAFVGWAEGPTCVYTATVTTSAVCRANRPNGICGPTTGGGQNAVSYDFSLGSNQEYSWVSADGTYTYYFQPCGQVRNQQCNDNNGTSSSMMCQAVNGAQDTYDIAYYDANLVAWYQISNGWQMFVQDGTSCGGLGYERALTVNFLCASTPAFLNLTESSSTPCWYTAWVQTPQACSPISNGATGGVLIPPSSTGNGLEYEAITKCGGIYNLLPLSTTDLVWQSPGEYKWVFRPCGAISSDSNCTNAAAATSGGWMVCQDSEYGYGAYEGSSWNQHTVSWTPTRNGVLMIQADGSQCGSYGARVTRAYFLCNPAYTTAQLVNVTEGPTCTYTLLVYTNLVCPSPATTCGGAGYDLSALTTRGDLQYNGTNGYNYYFNPCGTVQNSQCQANLLTQEAMMCQASQSDASSYDIAVYVPQAITWTAISGGVQMRVQDGSTCDNHQFERVLTVNFICGTNYGYRMNVTEVKTCYYVAYVQTGLACNQVNNNGGGGSSGLSGGAIAGIVIGSVVGALIILALLLVVCCGAMGGGLRKKNTTDEPKGSGRYGGHGDGGQPVQRGDGDCRLVSRRGLKRSIVSAV